MKFIHRLGLNMYLAILFYILIENRDWSAAKFIFIYLLFLAASIMLMWNSGEKDGKK